MDMDKSIYFNPDGPELLTLAICFGFETRRAQLMRGADAVAQILKLEGVEVLFSYPNHALIDAAAKVGIRPIIARGEKTLINIADGYARATNGQKPSVLVVQAGPGIENAFVDFAQAYSDGVPLLMLAGGPEHHCWGV